MAGVMSAGVMANGKYRLAGEQLAGGNGGISCNTLAGAGVAGNGWLSAALWRNRRLSAGSWRLSAGGGIMWLVPSIIASRRSGVNVATACPLALAALFAGSGIACIIGSGFSIIIA